MIGKLIEWAINNRLVVFLLVAALAGVGGYGFIHINVEAYPDPAPAIVELATQYPGASAEEVERQVTIPIEVALAGMPGLKEIRSKSLFGLSYVSNQFEYGVDFNKVRLEVLSRIPQGDLPPGVSPQISPASPIAEIVEYVLCCGLRMAESSPRRRWVRTAQYILSISAATRPTATSSMSDRGIAQRFPSRSRLTPSPGVLSPWETSGAPIWPWARTAAFTWPGWAQASPSRGRRAIRHRCSIPGSRIAVRRSSRSGT